MSIYTLIHIPSLLSQYLTHSRSPYNTLTLPHSYYRLPYFPHTTSLTFYILLQLLIPSQRPHHTILHSSPASHRLSGQSLAKQRTVTNTTPQLLRDAINMTSFSLMNLTTPLYAPALPHGLAGDQSDRERERERERERKKNSHTFLIVWFSFLYER